MSEVSVKTTEQKVNTAKKPASIGRKIFKGICIFLSAVLGCGVLFLASWIMPWGYSSEIKKYAAIDGACAATVKSYTDDAGRLNFVKKDGSDFVIMDITDVHMGCSPYTIRKDKLAMEAIHKLADKIKPDLIVSTGDCVYYAPTKGSLMSGHSQKVFASFMETLGIPWTVAFGNHESEVYGFASREKMGEILSSGEYKNCVFVSETDGITGVGNQVITIRNNDASESVAQVLMLIDSNDYTGIMSNYDSIHQDQIDWYKSEITEIAKGEGVSPEKIGSLAFFHIPVTEYETAYEAEGAKILFGKKNEPVCHPANTDNDVFFEQMLEFGSTRAMFAGHDHTNNYCVDYKGILLTYGLSIDYNTYKDIDKTDEYRGATMIKVHGTDSFDIEQCGYGEIK